MLLRKLYDAPIATTGKFPPVKPGNRERTGMSPSITEQELLVIRRERNAQPSRCRVDLGLRSTLGAHTRELRIGVFECLKRRGLHGSGATA